MNIDWDRLQYRAVQYNEITWQEWLFVAFIIGMTIAKTFGL